MKHFLLILILLSLYSTSGALPPQPMESVTKYNVVLVHGAADAVPVTPRLVPFFCNSSAGLNELSRVKTMLLGFILNCTYIIF